MKTLKGKAKAKEIAEELRQLKRDGEITADQLDSILEILFED